MMSAIAIDPGFPGAGRVVRELANISDNIKYQGPFRPLDHYDSDYVLLPAWHPSYQQISHPKKVVVWTSPILQSEYTPVEFEFMQTIVKLLDEGKLYALWLGSKDWLSVMGSGRRAFYCPYPVTLPPPKMSAPQNPPLNVSLFGPLSPRKNFAVQAFAAAKAGCHVHTTDQRANSLLDTLGLRVPPYYHDWQIPPRYHDLVCSMDIGLQCSVPGSESFSYVVWDHISRGVPCLSTVEWTWDLGFPLFVTDPYNIDYLVYCINSVASWSFLPKLRRWAEEFAERRNETVKAILETELGLKC